MIHAEGLYSSSIVSVASQVNLYSDENQILSVQVLPKNARVTIPGFVEKTSFPEGKFDLELPSGRYSIRVEADGFQTTEHIVKIVAAPKKVRLALSPVNKSLRFSFYKENGFEQIENVLDKAVIYVNNKKLVPENGKLSGLPIGVHNIRIEHPDYNTWTDVVKVYDSHMSVRVTLLDKMTIHENVALGK